uniref:Unspecified product n=1 Tax=Parastrongyloides trichosuri TaxID=131310 RepID=A0A0N5A7I9_PARTI
MMVNETNLFNSSTLSPEEIIEIAKIKLSSEEERISALKVYAVMCGFMFLAFVIFYCYKKCCNKKRTNSDYVLKKNLDYCVNIDNLDDSLESEILKKEKCENLIKIEKQQMEDYNYGILLIVFLFGFTFSILGIYYFYKNFNHAIKTTSENVSDGIPAHCTIVDNFDDLFGERVPFKEEYRTIIHVERPPKKDYTRYIALAIFLCGLIILAIIAYYCYKNFFLETDTISDEVESFTNIYQPFY